MNVGVEEREVRTMLLGRKPLRVRTCLPPDFCPI